MTAVYDLVGVGIGPFNLSLAALADRTPGISAAFLDENPEFSWHPGMLIEGTTLQVPFLADLVTLVDPTSPWSFLAYLRARDRLYPFYFTENMHISRREYSQYCRWVADALASCTFGCRVTEVSWDATAGVFRVQADSPSGRRELSTRHVVLGVGAVASVPGVVRSSLGKVVFHSASYLDHVGSLREAGDVTVVGSGQSGAEVVLDVLRAQPATRLRWLTRSPAFAPMEYSKLGLEHFTPDYTRYFHALPQRTRDRLVPGQWQLYKASSAGTLAEIQAVLYERGADGPRPDVTLMPNVDVTGCRLDAGRVTLSCRHAEQGRGFEVDTERVVLATGYATQRPACLRPLTDLIRWDGQGRYQVGDDYRVALDDSVSGSLYVQNAEMHTHGVGAPDLGLGAYRAATIINSITGTTTYRLPEHTAFTSFGVDRASPYAGGSPCP